MTLVELVVVMALTLIIGTTMYTFFKTNLFTYLNLQKDATSFTGLAVQSQRIGNVMRGLTNVVSVDTDEITIYGYFFPTDTYVSLIHYYLNTNGTLLYADVTPMTSNPPIGTPITAKLKTYTIIDNFKQSPSVNLFTYLDSAGAVMNLPIADLHTIKGIRINLAVSTEIGDNDQAMTLEVSLRNRKTNL